jgi:hypothetical protein
VVVRPARIEVDRLIPELVGELVPVQPTRAAFGVEGVDERVEVRA